MYLFQGEIRQANHRQRLFHVAQLRLGELIGSRPRGQNRAAGKASHNLPDRLLMQANHIGVVQVIFGRELVRRVDEKSDDKSGGGEQIRPHQ